MPLGGYRGAGLQMRLAHTTDCSQRLWSYDLMALHKYAYAYYYYYYYY